MSIKQQHKTSKKGHIKEQDREDNRRFVMILIGATILLMLLMYFIFVR